MKQNPGIFNDVIGPIMRGPSSSHTAASWRAAKMSMDILNEPLKKAIVDFDKDGAWAPNYRAQGTTLGIDGGLLGLEMADDRMKHTEQVALERGISINYEVNAFKTNHVNTVRLKLEGIHGNIIEILAASLGGGSVEIQEVNGFKVKICGDYYELLLFNNLNNPYPENIDSIFPLNKSIVVSVNGDKQLINIKLSKEITEEALNQLKDNIVLDTLIVVNPVLPVISGNEKELPFSSIASLLEYAEKEDLDLGAIGLMYEAYQSGLSEAVVIDKMINLVEIIENSIQTGLAGTVYEDRILPQQSH